MNWRVSKSWWIFSRAHGTGAALVKAGYDSWFVITVDYVFGHDLEQITAAVVRASGGPAFSLCARNAVRDFRPDRLHKLIIQLKARK